MKKDVFDYILLTNHLSFKTYFQNVHQHAGGKWLIHGTNHNNDHQLQSMELPYRLS